MSFGNSCIICKKTFDDIKSIIRSYKLIKDKKQKAMTNRQITSEQTIISNRLHRNVKTGDELICNVPFLWHYLNIMSSILYLSNAYRRNCNDGVMDNVLISSLIDREFQPPAGQTKKYKIGMCFFTANHAAIKRKCKGIRIIMSV